MIAGLSIAACQSDDPNIVRGKRLAVASLPAGTQARIYEAAARGSFDVEGTSLLLDQRLLPRTIGLSDGGRVAENVVAAMRERGSIKGTCEPSLTGTVGTARCRAEFPGYVVRYSPVFAITKDSVQVYLYAQKYDTRASGKSETLRFERAYQIVRNGDDWHAVREGHVPKEARGER